MPLVNGGTLTETLKQGPLSLDAIERIVEQICEALDYAHSKGIIHRDIKPSNILMDERQNCLVADFGLARIVEGATVMTLAGTVMGTPAYMSPEQAAGAKLGPATDIYSVGIMLFEMLTGRVPYVAETPAAVMLGHLAAPLPPPRSINPALAPVIEAVVLKALARSPEERFTSARELHASLSEAIDQTPSSERARPVFEAAAAATIVRQQPFHPGTFEISDLTTKRPVDSRSAHQPRPPVAPSPERDRTLPYGSAIIGALVLLSAASAGIWVLRTREDIPKPETRITQVPPEQPPKSTVPTVDPGFTPARGNAGDPTGGGDGAQVKTRGNDPGVAPRPSPLGGTAPRQEPPSVMTRTLPGSESDAANSVTVSPGGQWLAAGYDKGVVKIWDPVSGKEVGVLSGHVGKVSAVAFSPDGRHLAATSGDRTVAYLESRHESGNTPPRRSCRCRAERGVQSGRPPGCDGERRCHREALDRRLGPRSRHVDRSYRRRHERRVRRRREVADIGQSRQDGPRVGRRARARGVSRRRRPAAIWSVAVSREVRLIAAAADDGTILVFNGETGRLNWSAQAHRGAAWSVAFSPDGTQLASGGADALVRTWDIETGRPRQTFPGHKSWVRSVAFGQAGDWLASASGDGDVRTWRLEKP